MGLMSKANQIDANFSYLSDGTKVSSLLYTNFQLQLHLVTEIFSTSLFQSNVSLHKK